MQPFTLGPNDIDWIIWHGSIWAKASLQLIGGQMQSYQWWRCEAPQKFVKDILSKMNHADNFFSVLVVIDNCICKLCVN